MSQNKQKPTHSSGDESAGRIEIDGRGRNVWQWKDSQLDSTTIMLRQLDNDALELEPTRQVRVTDGSNPRDAKQIPPDSQARPRKSASKPSRAETHEDIEMAFDVPTIETTMPVQLGGGFDPYDNG